MSCSDAVKPRSSRSGNTWASESLTVDSQRLTQQHADERGPASVVQNACGSSDHRAGSRLRASGPVRAMPRLIDTTHNKMIAAVPSIGASTPRWRSDGDPRQTSSRSDVSAATPVAASHWIARAWASQATSPRSDVLSSRNNVAFGHAGAPALRQRSLHSGSNARTRRYTSGRFARHYLSRIAPSASRSYTRQRRL